MASAVNTATSTQRVAIVTGFTIPVSKWRKLSGEPVTGAKPSDYIIVPAGAIARYPPAAWRDFGGVRTYHFWKAAGQMPATNVVASNGGVLTPSNRNTPQDPRGGQEYCGGARGPHGWGNALPCVRDLSKEDLEAAECLRNLRQDGGRESREREERPDSDMHPELLDVCSEGGSESSCGGSPSGGSEEEQERSVQGSSSFSSGDECASSPRPLKRARTSGLSPASRDSEQISDCSSGQEDSETESCEILE